MNNKLKIKISKNGLLLKKYPEFADNKEIVLLAVKNLPWSIHYASDRLKNDIDVVIEAVTKYGIELHDISSYNPNFCNNKKIVFSAVTNKYPNSIIYASKSLLKDINFLSSICFKRKDLSILKTYFIKKDIYDKVLASIFNKKNFNLCKNNLLYKISIDILNLIYNFL